MTPNSHKFIIAAATSAACPRASTAKERGHILAALIYGLALTAQEMGAHIVSRWVFLLNKKIPHRLAGRTTHS